MRHRVKGRKFNRTSEHRRALMRNLATSLIKHKKITTTVEKAKELRKFIEPIITKAKTDSVATKRYVSDDIKDRDIVKELFTEVIAKVGERPGGYTRIVRLGQRKGDGAELAIIELVDFSGIVKPKPTKKAKAESITPADKTEEAKEEKKEEKPKAKAKKAPAREKKPVEKKTTKEKATKEKKAPVKKTSTTRKSG